MNKKVIAAVLEADNEAYADDDWNQMIRDNDIVIEKEEY